jgi:hypothetical protein
MLPPMMYVCVRCAVRCACPYKKRSFSLSVYTETELMHILVTCCCGIGIAV